MEPYIKSQKCGFKKFLTPIYALKNGTKSGQKIGYFQTAPLMERTAIFQGMLVNETIGKKGEWSKQCIQI